MAKTLKDLFLALLNATLILVALCLFLLVMVLTKANSLSATFAQNLQIVTPLQTSIQDTGTEVAALRADLAAITSQSQDVGSAAMVQLQSRVKGLEDRLSEMQQSFGNLTEAPTRLVDHAIQETADQIVGNIERLKGCVPPAT